MEMPTNESLFGQNASPQPSSSIGNTLSSLGQGISEGISEGINQEPSSASTSASNTFGNPLFWVLSAFLLFFLILVFIKREKTAEYMQQQIAAVQNFWATQVQAPLTPSIPGPYEKTTANVNNVDEVHIDTTVTATKGPNSKSIDVSRSVDVDTDVTNINIEPDDSYSRIQASKSSGKKGWCFVGEDRTFRSCVEVGENDKCMSGDIFPSKEICENPSLRP